LSEKAIQLKSQIVDEVVEMISKSSSLVLIDYKGLTVAQDTELRNEFRSQGVDYKVIKNRILVRAFNKLGYTGFDSDLEGPTAVAFGSEDITAPAKVLTAKAKQFPKIKIKSGLVDGTYLDVAGVRSIASLQSKEVLIAKMLGSLLAPISGLAGVLNNTLASLPRVLQAVADAKAE